MPPADPTAKLAAALTAECEKKGMSGAELARRSGVPQTGVAAILRGDTDPRLSTLLSLLAGLGRDLAWLHRQGLTPPPAAG